MRCDAVRDDVPARRLAMSTPVELKRAISLPLLTLYGLGTILGAGIYVLVEKVAGLADMYASISFALAAVLAVLTGLRTRGSRRAAVRAVEDAGDRSPVQCPGYRHLAPRCLDGPRQVASRPNGRL